MDEKLAELGIVRDDSKVRPNRYWCYATKSHLDIKDETLEDVMEMIYEEGLKEGVRQGKEMRSSQFKNLINDIEN